ncbi:DNA-directed RNA polymerase subunit delta [Cohnella lubricantis]|uniref:Probable DNA-directed RNA polymerase subunit delta n=1 Tax=Cohnella lubricantis TaxID=2163172 RepID=A0A841TGI3_9BACL|nr:DNA-directed RNA polymerase subunit delta [Cohnella lubricantis]MBB6679476.1 DNA-directed RNA polymerase subunit delta [Cohnella lubricantis]MBP2118213.1 DNA-directed RNA polymerase subunit delta [Cohnella lubricantis]
MSAEYVLKFDAEKIREMPMVDLAFQVLKAANTPFYYRDLMMEIAKIRGLSEDQINDVIAQLYTEINIDGRFACVGGNVWGLKRWYPVEKSEDAVAGGAKRPRIINDDDDLDDEDLYGEDEEETFTPDEEGFELFDEEREELFDEGEEAAEVDEEVIDEEEDAEIDEELAEEEEEESEDEEDDFEDADEDEK